MFKKICNTHKRFSKTVNYRTFVKKINISDISNVYHNEINNSVKKLNFKPKLVSFLCSNDPGAIQYAKWTQNTCFKLGINFELKKINKNDLEKNIIKANNDSNINGIMVYYPCFGTKPSFYGDTMDNYLRDTVSYKKDVEGLCYMYRNNLYHNKRFIDNYNRNKSILPCTPLGIIKILESDLLAIYNKKLTKNKQLTNKIITVINRSTVVGHPTAAMLANDGADVYSVDLDSIYLMKKGQIIDTDYTLDKACKISDVIISGVPDRNFLIDPLWIKPHTTIINVSPYNNLDINKVNHIKGIKYVQQVGSVTVAMLMRNLITLINNYQI